MRPSTKACGLVFGSGLVGPRLEIAWHGGEPLVVPLAWYESAFELIAARRPADVEIGHYFQTNGLMLDEAWTRFFARTRAKVGLSIDGPAELHDANRRTRRGGGTHAGAMRAVRLLQERRGPLPGHHGPDRTRAGRAGRAFRFLRRERDLDVGFNVEEIEGRTDAPPLPGPRPRPDSAASSGASSILSGTRPERLKAARA